MVSTRLGKPGIDYFRPVESRPEESRPVESRPEESRPAVTHYHKGTKPILRPLLVCTRACITEPKNMTQ